MGKVMVGSSKQENNESLNWGLKQDGEGNLAGCEIGICADDQGIVVWHGRKLIDCPEIAPFAVNITGECESFKLTEPNNVDLALNVPELAVLKAELEAQLFNALDAEFADNDGSELLFGHHPLFLLYQLSSAYNVGGFNTWGKHQPRGDYSASTVAEIVTLPLEDGKILCNDSTKFVDADGSELFLYPINTNAFHTVSKQLGGTPLPPRFANLAKDILVVDFNNEVVNGSLGVQTVVAYQTITIDGVSVGSSVFSDSESDLMFQWSVLIHTQPSVFIDGGDVQCSESEFESDLNSLKAKAKGCVGSLSTRDFLWSLTSVLDDVELKDIKSVSFVPCASGGGISSHIESVAVLTHDGKTHELEVA